MLGIHNRTDPHWQRSASTGLTIGHRIQPLLDLLPPTWPAIVRILSVIMVVYVCDCLNVSIDAVAKGKEEKRKQHRHSCPLGGAVLVELGDGGFNFRLGALVKTEDESSWKTFTCLNCKKDTLCIERTLFKEASSCNLIYMNKDLRRYADDDLSSNAFYSPSYGIILNPVDYITRPDCRHQIESYVDLEMRLKTLRQQSDRYLLEEEGRIDDCVRRFEMEQREKFDKIKAKAKSDKDTMMSVLWKNYSKDDESTSASEDASEQPDASPATVGAECKCPKPTINPDYGCVPVPDIDRHEIFTVDDLDSCGSSVAGDKSSNAGDEISTDSDNEDEDFEVPSYQKRETLKTEETLKAEETFKAGGPWLDESFRNCPLEAKGMMTVFRSVSSILMDRPH